MIGFLLSWPVNAELSPCDVVRLFAGCVDAEMGQGKDVGKMKGALSLPQAKKMDTTELELAKAYRISHKLSSMSGVFARVQRFTLSL